MAAIPEDFLKNGPPILLHGNARPHTAKKTIACINKLGFQILPHPPYSPDIAFTDYPVFCSLQHHISNKIYHSDNKVKADISIGINRKTFGAEEFLAYLQDGKSLFQKVVTSTD